MGWIRQCRPGMPGGRNRTPQQGSYSGVDEVLIDGHFDVLAG